jgi:ABC-type transport system involved in multi-copper enzyme maturation permease subunit
LGVCLVDAFVYGGVGFGFLWVKLFWFLEGLFLQVLGLLVVSVVKSGNIFVTLMLNYSSLVILVHAVFLHSF